MSFDVNLPPSVQCPPWCAGRCCFWEPTDDGGYIAGHESDNLAPPGSGIEITIYQPDEWFNGELLRMEPVLMVDQQPLSIELLQTVLDMLGRNSNWVACQSA